MAGAVSTVAAVSLARRLTGKHTTVQSAGDAAPHAESAGDAAPHAEFAGDYTHTMDYGFLAGDRDPPRPADASWESAWRLIWTDRERQGTYRRGKLTDDQLETHLATLDTDGAHILMGPEMDVGCWTAPWCDCRDCRSPLPWRPETDAAAEAMQVEALAPAGANGGPLAPPLLVIIVCIFCMFAESVQKVCGKCAESVRKV